MARGVDSTIVVPAPQIQPGQPVADSYVSGGMTPLYQCTNTLYEQKRGQLVCDYDPNAIIDATGQTARYRVKVLGNIGSGKNETVKVAFFGEFVESSSGAMVITLTQGGNSSTYTWSSDVTPAAWVAGTDLTFDDEAENNDINVAITTSTNMTTTDLLGISLYYERDRAELQAGVYDSGFVPMDVAQAAGEKPVSTRALVQLHKNHEHLWEHRVGMVVSASFVRSKLGAGASNDLIWAAVPVPAGVTEARFYLYMTGITGGAVSTITIASSGETITDDDDTGTLTTSSWNGPYDLTVAENTHETFTLTNTSLDGATIDAVCGYWRDATYEFE